MLFGHKNLRIVKALQTEQTDVGRLSYGIIILDDDSIKLAEDFKYIFSRMINIEDIVVYGNDHLGDYDIYICCTYDRHTAMKKLRSKGYIYKRHYYFAEDYFFILDDWKKKKITYITNKSNLKGWVKSVVFGFSAKHGLVLPDDSNRFVLKGRYGKVRKKSQVNILNLTTIALYLVLGAIELIPQLFYLRRSYRNYDYICFHFTSDAIRFKNDYPIFANRVVTTDEVKAHTMASMYFRAVYYDKRQNTCGCFLPFYTIWIGEGGVTRLCECPEFLNVSLGRVGVTENNKIWESPIADIIRLSVINRTYTFCSRELCGKFSDSQDRYESLERIRLMESVHYPQSITVANDSVCNLHCPSCRKRAYVMNTNDREIEIEACTHSLQESLWLEKADKLLIGAGGETFFSKYYKKIMYDVAGKRNSILIMTNGTIFTPNEWDKIANKYAHISFMVSIDAATKETYEKVRCGGNYERLMKNMEYLSILRKSKKVDYVAVNMIVQRANYKEIPDFIRWTINMGFDRVNLSHIRNWGTYSDYEFENNVSMFMKDGVPRLELTEVLMDPICRDPIVNMQWNKTNE